MTDDERRNGVASLLAGRELEEPPVPHNLEAEEAVLGSVLKDPTSISLVGSLTPAEFYGRGTRHIFAAMLEAAAAGVPPDIHVIVDRLHQHGTYDESGGLEYLSQIRLETASAAHIEHYVAIVERTAAMRQLIHRAQCIAEMAYRDNVDAARALQQAERWILELGEWYHARHPVNGQIGRSLVDLMALELPPLALAVDPWLPEGLALLGGRPKLGKSFLLLHIGLAVAYGGFVLGGYRATKGDVLFLSLEDSDRRVQQRARQVLNGRAAPSNFTYETEWPRLDEGGLERIDAWCREHAERRLVVLDTWPVVSPRKNGKLDAYQQDFDNMRGVKRLSDERRVATVVSMHNSKPVARADSDFLDNILGTTGFTGAADTILGLRTERLGGASHALAFKGRDVELGTLALRRDPLTIWACLGNADEVCLPPERVETLRVVRDAGRPLSPAEVARGLGEPVNRVRVRLFEMVAAGQMERTPNGTYTPPNLANGGNA